MSKGSCAGVEGLKGCEDPTDPRGWVAFSCITEALAEIECVVGANASGNAHDQFAEMTTQADEGAGTGYSPVHQLSREVDSHCLFPLASIPGAGPNVRNQPINHNP